MPVDYSRGAVASEGLRARLEQFSQVLGRTVRVVRGDTAAAPPPVPPAPDPLSPRQKPGCLGAIFGAKPVPVDPAVYQGRVAGEQGHASGGAADIVVDGLTTREVSEAAARSGLFDGVGHYEADRDIGAHTHVDVTGRGPSGAARLWLVGGGAAAAGATLGWFAADSLYRRRPSDS